MRNLKTMSFQNINLFFKIMQLVKITKVHIPYSDIALESLSNILYFPFHFF